MKTTKKLCLVALLAGGTMFGGCLGLGGIFNPQRILASAIDYAILEFTLDNDGVVDIFEDGNVAG